MNRIRTVGIVVVALLMTLPAAGSLARSSNYAAPMSGDQEVDPVDTRGTGVATFKHRAEGLVYKLNVANLEDIFASHIHCNVAGANGPIGVTLFMADPPVTVSGTLAEGTITAPDENNACEWSDLDEVIAAIENGGAYVNVHTTAHPSGEIRGQIR